MVEEQPGASARNTAADSGLWVLGPFKFIAGGTPVDVASKKSRALLAVLATSPAGRATRERLCGLLWAGRGEEQARSSLRQTLTALRRDAGPAGTGLLKTWDD